MEGVVRVRREVIEQMLREARERPGEECCGLLAGRDGVITEAFPATNALASATAFEIALKVKELTRVVAEPYSSADFRHGPIAMARDGFPVMVIAPGGAVEEDMRGLAADLRKLEAELVVISDDQALLEQAHLALPLPGGLPEWLSPLVAVIPGQLFGLALAQAKGFDPDQPAGLKKVTETL